MNAITLRQATVGAEAADGFPIHCQYDGRVFTMNAPTRPIADLIAEALSKAPRVAARREKSVTMLDAVRRVARAAFTSRCTLPILACVRITVSGGVMALECTDMERVIIERLPTDARDMDCLAPVKRVIEALKTTPGALVEFVPNDADGSVRIGPALIACMPLEDFPMVHPSQPFPLEFDMPAADLLTLAATARHAISTEETRYYLNGICLQFDAGKLRAVATDGHRLACASVASPAGSAGSSVNNIIIPRLTVGDMVALLEKRSGQVRVSMSDTKIALQIGDVFLMSKLVDGSFPEWQRACPSISSLSKRATMKVADLERAVKIGQSANSGERSAPVKFTVAGKSLTVSGANHEGNSASDTLELRKPFGDVLEVGYQARYLLDLLAVIEGDVTFYWSDATAPSRIADTANPDRVFILMPFRI